MVRPKKKIASKPISEAKAEVVKTELKPSEKATLLNYQKKLEAREGMGPPKFNYDKEKGILNSRTEDELIYQAQLAETFGTGDMSAAYLLQRQVFGALPTTDGSLAYNGTLAIVDGIKPQDELEGALAAQMTVCHNLLMQFASRAVHQDKLDAVDRQVNRVAKLMNVFTKQVETLTRYRAKGKQVIQVQHVTVESGGQAVIGDIHNQGGG